MSLMVVLQDLSRGGAQRVVSSLFPELRSIVDSHLVVLTDKLDYDVDLKAGQKLTLLKASRILFALPKLAFLIRREQPKVLFSTIFFTDVLVFFLAKLFSPSSKLVFRSCNYYSKAFPRITILSKLVLYCYARADAVICSTEAMRKDFETLIPKLKNKITVINNPVSSERIFEAGKEDVRHRWLDGKEYFVFLAVAKLKAQKNLTLLLDAFSKFEGDEVRLLILGQGDEEAKLRQRAVDLGIDKKVDFLGFKANPYSYWARSDAFVLSSDYEGFPNVLIESMCLGVPVVSTDCPSGPSEIVEDGETGLLCKTGDPDELFKSLNKIYSDSDLRYEIGQKALKRVRIYDTLIVATRFRELFGALASDR